MKNSEFKKSLMEKNFIGLFNEAQENLFLKNHFTDPNIDKLKAKIQQLKDNAEPCPFCGSINLSFKYQQHSGHGDSGFDMARIECNDCSGSKGNGSNYGSPSKEDEIKAWKVWNDRTKIDPS